MLRPAGSGRGSVTGPAAGSLRTDPSAGRATHSCPDSAKASSSQASSAAYPTMPAGHLPGALARG